jgi:anthranilate synthase component 2
MILLLDNYDSFSYNLYQAVGSVNPDVRVVRGDALTVEEIAALKPSRIILSPGPGRPADAGVCEAVVLSLGETIPILGVCLGHQAICEAFGGAVGYAKRLVHGKPSEIQLDTSCPIFRGLPEVIAGARYHSLAAEAETLPACLQTTARTADGEIMGVRHTAFPIFGLQFHPESILTPLGNKIIENFVKGDFQP